MSLHGVQCVLKDFEETRQAKDKEVVPGLKPIAGEHYLKVVSFEKKNPELIGSSFLFQHDTDPKFQMLM